MTRLYKRILALLLAVLLLGGTAPAAFAEGGEIVSGTCGDNLTWELNTGTGKMTIRGTGEMRKDSYADAPWYSYRGTIRTVTIENGVTSIGDYAFFNCASFASITIPDSVTSIGDSAFYGCTNLMSITIPDSVTGIGDYVFFYCTSLTAISVDTQNSNYSSDAYGVLYNKDKKTLIQYPIGNLRTSFTIPDGVTSIGDSAFYGCTNLMSITIGNGVTSIGDYAFGFCESLESIAISDSVTSIGTWAFCNCTSLANITIPDSVTGIGAYAFYECTSLASVTIPDNVTGIGEYAFAGCTSLETIMIPGSVSNIGFLAFSGCTSLTAISVDTQNSNYSSDENGVLYNKSKTELIQYPIGNPRTSFAIPDGVTGIGDSAFYDCTNLMSITIGNGMTSIGIGAFGHCTSLASVTIANSVTSIGDLAFNECVSLASVILSDDLTSICYGVFKGCTSLTSVTIPGSVTSIGERAFAECESLTSVTIPDSVTGIGAYAFYECTSLASITIPNSVTCIGYGAFGFCSMLTDVYYFGTLAEWEAIDIEGVNLGLFDATIWFILQYTAVFITDGVRISEQTYKAGDAIEKPVDPVKKGFAFTGWLPEVPATMPAEDMTFTAQFKENGKVRSVAVSDLTVQYKSSGKLTPVVKADEGVQYTVAYSGFDSGIISVDKNGNVTTVKGKTGTTTVTVTATDEYGNKEEAKCTVTVKYAFWQILIRIFLLGFIWY